MFELFIKGTATGNLRVSQEKVLFSFGTVEIFKFHLNFDFFTIRTILNGGFNLVPPLE